MKDYIAGLTKGEFEYEEPVIESAESVNAVIVEDCEMTGAFNVNADMEIRGVVLSTNEKVHTKGTFKGVENVIEYTVNAIGLSPGSTIKGDFNILTTAGELKVPFSFNIVRKTIQTASGFIVKDLESFYQIYIRDKASAKKIFLSPEFRAVVLKNDLYLNALYDQVKEQSDKDFALQGFLEGSGFKDVADAQNADTKETNEKKGISRFVLRSRKLKAEFTRLYLNFRMKRISIDKFTERCLYKLQGTTFWDMCLDTLEDEKERFEMKIAHAMLYALNGEGEKAREILSYHAEKLMDDRLHGGILYGTSLYIDTLTDNSKEAGENAKRYFFNAISANTAPWQLVLFQYHLDKNSEDNASIWLTRFKDAFAKGCTSPIIYLEAIRIINRNPMLLRVLNSFETQVIRFGYRYNLVEAAATARITELVSNETVTDMTHLYCLKKLYDEYNSDKILTALCSKMIRAGIHGPQYADVYEKAVKRSLSITQLYEYYLMSINKSSLKSLPESVLKYFVYDKGIDSNTKAYLYACVTAEREKNTEIYYLYRNNILTFTKERLKEGVIDDNLIILYRWLWDVTDSLEKELAPRIFRLQFTYKITIDSDVPVTLTIRHKEFNEPKKMPIKERHTYAFILSDISNIGDECVICFEDAGGRVYSDKSFPYSVERVLENRPFTMFSNEQCATDPYYLLYRYRMEKLSDERSNIHMYAKKLMESNMISKSFEKELRLLLYGTINPDAPEAKGPELTPIMGESRAVSELERRLATMLFTKKKTDEMAPVFEKLFNVKQESVVAEAYIAYQAFLYFVKKEKADEAIFPIIYKALSEGKEQLPVRLAALLKHDATGTKELSQEQINLYSEALGYFIRNNYYFSFLKELNESIEIPYFLADKTIIEIYNKPGRKIRIDYENGREAGKQKIALESFCGIYTHPVILFDGESLSYKINIQDTSGSIESYRSVVSCNESRTKDNVAYCRINNISRISDKKIQMQSVKDYFIESDVSEKFFNFI